MGSRLIVILGDQLSLDVVCPEDYRRGEDALWMAESAAEARRVWSHKDRLLLFLSAMRHFADELRDAGHRLLYRHADEQGNNSLAEQLKADLAELKPEEVIITRPGNWDLFEDLKRVLDAQGQAWRLQEDSSFFTTPADFARWADGRKQLRMEFFYREQRRRFRVLLDADDQPEGGQWNFDKDNRQSFGSEGPVNLSPPKRFVPDAISQKTREQIERRYPDHPGSMGNFDWPVSRAQALAALDDFIEHRLPDFGHYQDAIWVGEVYLFHSRISAALNLHLLHPREVVESVEQVYREGRVALNAAEGFIRQILGWREFVRGLYWLKMPSWRDDNALEAQQDLPGFFWTGETELNCLSDALNSTLNHGYAHHIQRLMVTGLFCLLLGVKPRQVHEWYLAVYVDAVEWVELPNTIGMSQFADGGVLASKPYIASGQYIDRMSNACASCPYRPREKTGARACPFTTMYWDFLIRHEAALGDHPRLKMQFRNLARLGAEDRDAIQQQAASWRRRWSESS